MSSTKIESVMARQRGAYDFESHYNDLCSIQNVCPIPAVKARLQENVLDLNGDRIRANDWIPILRSVGINKTLHHVAFRSYFQLLIDEQEGKNYKRKTPAIRSKEVTYRVCKALKDCLMSTPCLHTIQLQGLPLRERDMQSLSKGIYGNNTLKHLMLDHSRIGDEGLEMLAKGLRNNPTIETINLTGCSLTSNGAETLAKIIKFQAMKRHSEAWQDSLRYRRPDLDRQPGIRRITANINPMMGDAAARMLAEALKDDLWLKALDLQQCGLTDTGAQSLLDTLKFNTCIVVLDIRHNPMTNHTLIKQIIEHLTVNSCATDSQYKWIKAEPLQDPAKVKTKKRRNKALPSNFGKRAVVKTPTRGNVGAVAAGSQHRRAKSLGTPTRPLQPFTGQGSDVKPGLPWRTALRANRFKGYPPEASARDDGEDGVTVMEGEERRLRISASGPVSESEEESLSSTRVQPRGTVSDTDISISRDMRAAQVEIEMLRRKLRDEKRSRAQQDELIIQLTLENSQLKREMDEYRSKQSLLEDDEVLGSIERSFHQFHQFLELLRTAGLGQLITLSGIDEQNVPFAAPLPNPSKLSKHERLANLTHASTAPSPELGALGDSSPLRHQPHQPNTQVREAKQQKPRNPPAEPVFSPAFEAMVQQQQHQQKARDITQNAPLPASESKFDALYSKVLEETEGALSMQSEERATAAAASPPASHHSSIASSHHSSKHSSSKHSSSKHSAMLLEDLRVPSPKASPKKDDDDDGGDNDDEEISEELESIEDDDSF